MATRMRLPGSCLLAFLLIGTLGGCGGGSDSASTPAGPTATTEPSATSAPTQAPPSAAPMACSLVTAADVTAAFAVTAAPGAPGPNNSCEYGSTSSKLTIDGVAASLRIEADLVTSSQSAFDAAYLGDNGYASGDKLAGVGTIGYSALGSTDGSGLTSGAAKATVLTATGVTINIELGAVNSADQATLRTAANKAKVEALIKTAVEHAA